MISTRPPASSRQETLRSTKKCRQSEQRQDFRDYQYIKREMTVVPGQFTQTTDSIVVMGNGLDFKFDQETLTINASIIVESTLVAGGDGVASTFAGSILQNYGFISGDAGDGIDFT